MEEGPEPQEFMEHVEHSLHARHATQHGAKAVSAERSPTRHKESEQLVAAGHEEKESRHLRSAVFAALFAVMAAIGSLLSGHAANEAILLQTRASDQWSYYQATSTKSHLYELNEELLKAFTAGGSKMPLAGANSARLRDLETKAAGYVKERNEIEHKALDLEAESAHEFLVHQLYSFAVACFQISIVLTSVSILVNNGVFFKSSIAGGLLGIGMLIAGYFH
jgi:hypothetical protein